MIACGLAIIMSGSGGLTPSPTSLRYEIADAAMFDLRLWRCRESRGL